MKCDPTTPRLHGEHDCDCNDRTCLCIVFVGGLPVRLKDSLVLVLLVNYLFSTVRYSELAFEQTSRILYRIVLNFAVYPHSLYLIQQSLSRHSSLVKLHIITIVVILLSHFSLLYVLFPL